MDEATKKRNDNSQELLFTIFDLISQNIKELGTIKVASSKEEADELDGKYRTALNNVVEGVAVLPYTIDELKFAVNALEMVVSSINKSIVGTIEGNEIEILSRIYGKKNDAGKFDKYSASISDIVLKLKEIREQTGNNLMDFYS